MLRTSCSRLGAQGTPKGPTDANTGLHKEGGLGGTDAVGNELVANAKREKDIQ